MKEVIIDSVCFQKKLEEFLKRVNGNNVLISKVKEDGKIYLSIQDTYHKITNSCDSMLFGLMYSIYYGLDKLERNDGKFLKIIEKYANLLHDLKINKKDFGSVLRDIHDVSGCWHVAFASKLVATQDPNLPVIDRNVRKIFGIKDIYIKESSEKSNEEIIEYWCRVHKELLKAYEELDKTIVIENKSINDIYRKNWPELMAMTTTKRIDHLAWEIRKYEIREHVEL